MSESLTKKGKKEKDDKKEISFEQAMEELEQIVDQLEAGEVPLEEAIQLFQNGMKLSKTCHQKLTYVEQQVSLIIEEEGELVKKEFRLEEDPS
jgi:exodeoxyribonuclease VII small subunit